MSELPDTVVELLSSRPQLVQIREGYFEFYLDGEMVYDFEVCDAGRCLRWIEHMAGKSWVTPKHLQQFARLAANHLGQEYH